MEANRRSNLFVGLELKNGCDGTPFCRASHLGNLVNFFYVSAPSGGEEDQVIVRGSSEKVLDEIAFILLGCTIARLHANHAFAAAPLRAKCAHGRAPDKAGVRDADDATLIGDKVSEVDLLLVSGNCGEA